MCDVNKNLSGALHQGNKVSAMEAENIAFKIGKGRTFVGSTFNPE